MELLSVPAIVAIVQAIKKAGMPSHYAPLVSILLGAAAGMTFMSISIEGLGVGLILGLSASGLFSGGKAMLEHARMKTSE